MARDDASTIADQLAAQVRELLQGAEEQAKQVMEAAEAEVARIREAAAEAGRRRIEDARSALDELEGRLGTTDPPPAPRVPEPPAPAPAPVTEKPRPPEPVVEPVSPTPGGGDESAARLVAMKMALDGAPRDDVRSRLAADYSVADLDGLLDDVFAKAGK